jgi:phosphatidylinositol-4,5-bisphosphate 3-kinase
MATVMGKPGHPTFEAFVALACDAYCVLRKNALLLTTLFSLMLSCGIPQLQKETDLLWLKETLLTQATEEQARAHFKNLITVAMNTRTTQYNDAVHLVVHAQA